MEMNYNIRVGKAMFMIVLYIYVILSVSPALAQTGVSKGLDSIGAIYNIKYEILMILIQYNYGRLLMMTESSDGFTGYLNLKINNVKYFIDCYHQM